MPKPGAARTGSVPKASQYFKKYATIIIILLLLTGGIAAALVVGVNNPKNKTSAPPDVQGCGPYKKDGVATIDNQKFNVEIAYSEAARIKGLSGRPCILADQGLLMDFGKEGHYFIWMKDMKFPIDVVWIDSAHKIAAIEIDFKPSTYNQQHPEKSERRVNQNPARYVLEVKANTAKAAHWALGTPVYFQKS